MNGVSLARQKILAGVGGKRSWYRVRVIIVGEEQYFAKARLLSSRDTFNCSGVTLSHETRFQIISTGERLSMSSSALPSSPPRRAQLRGSAPYGKSHEDLVIYCSICFLPVPSDNVTDHPGNRNVNTLPLFWLTSCGHITCSSHIFPNGGTIIQFRGGGEDSRTSKGRH